MKTEAKKNLTDAAMAELHAAGFQVHQGGPDAGDLAGRFWWTRMQDGWSEPECDPDEHDTEDDAWWCAYMTLVNELMEA